MSIWSDIQDRSAGELRDEEFKKIYPGHCLEKNLLEDGEYKGEDYRIFTNGKYPFIAIRVNMAISFFSGSGQVKIPDKDGKVVELKRTTSKGGYSIYTLELNRDDDFVLGEHNGKKYSLDMLRDIAKDIIDQILKCERKFQDSAGKE